MGFLYVIKLREFITIGASVYKIGRTDRPLKQRINQYPKGSNLIYFVEVPVGSTCIMEAKLIKSLKENEDIRQCIEYGTEYFEGEVGTIINIINKITTEKYIDVKHEEEIEEEEIEEQKNDVNRKKVKCPFCHKQLSRVERLRYHLLESSVCSSSTLNERIQICKILDMNTSELLSSFLYYMRKAEKNWDDRELDLLKMEKTLLKQYHQLVNVKKTMENDMVQITNNLMSIEKDIQDIQKQKKIVRDFPPKLPI